MNAMISKGSVFGRYKKSLKIECKWPNVTFPDVWKFFVVVNSKKVIQEAAEK
jgi:hypothetical protein